jgi:hypothetical protein
VGEPDRNRSPGSSEPGRARGVRQDPAIVERQDAPTLGSEGLAPRGTVTARSRPESVRPQETADSRGRDPHPELASSTRILRHPTWGLLAHAQDKLSDLLADGWPAPAGTRR